MYVCIYIYIYICECVCIYDTYMHTCTWVWTGRSAAICALTPACTALSSSVVSGLPYAKSKRSLSASQSEPRWRE